MCSPTFAIQPAALPTWTGAGKVRWQSEDNCVAAVLVPNIVRTPQMEVKKLSQRCLRHRRDINVSSSSIAPRLDGCLIDQRPSVAQCLGHNQ